MYRNKRYNLKNITKANIKRRLPSIMKKMMKIVAMDNRNQKAKTINNIQYFYASKSKRKKTSKSSKRTKSVSQASQQVSQQATQQPQQATQPQPSMSDLVRARFQMLNAGDANQVRVAELRRQMALLQQRQQELIQQEKAYKKKGMQSTQETQTDEELKRDGQNPSMPRVASEEEKQQVINDVERAKVDDQINLLKHQIKQMTNKNEGLTSDLKEVRTKLDEVFEDSRSLAEENEKLAHDNVRLTENRNEAVNNLNKLQKKVVDDNNMLASMIATKNKVDKHKLDSHK